MMLFLQNIEQYFTFIFLWKEYFSTTTHSKRDTKWEMCVCVCVVFPLFISSSLLSYFPEHYVMVNNVEENTEFNTICTHYRHVTVLIKLTMIVTYTNLIHIPTNCVFS